MVSLWVRVYVCSLHMSGCNGWVYSICETAEWALELGRLFRKEVVGGEDCFEKVRENDCRWEKMEGKQEQRSEHKSPDCTLGWFSIKVFILQNWCLKKEETTIWDLQSRWFLDYTDLSITGQTYLFGVGFLSSLRQNKSFFWTFLLRSSFWQEHFLLSTSEINLELN